MTDLISRCELFNKLATIPAPPEANELKAEVYRVIQQMETIDKWIPCSERLPSNFSEDETVLATTDVDGDRVIPMFAFDVKSFYLKGYISAWMPLPEPYREEE